MSETLNFIKSQREKGLDDYSILQATKRMANNPLVKKSKIEATGGAAFSLNGEQVKSIIEQLTAIENNIRLTGSSGYRPPGFEALLKAASSGIINDPKYNYFADIQNEI